MNSIREVNRINQRELDLGVSGKGSWHDEYKDSAYVFVGGLAYELTEGDVIAVFSQFGEVVNINLPRDKETGKTKGFGFVMYEDQRSTVLAVDNMNGAIVVGRTIRVDHCRNYRQPGERNDDGDHIAPEEPTYNAMPPILDASDDSDLSDSEPDDQIDEEDPMAAFLRAEKKKEKGKSKGITNGKDKKRKHDGESKEERRARKEAKRAKKVAKELKKASKVEKVREERSGDIRSQSHRNGSEVRDGKDRGAGSRDRPVERDHRSSTRDRDGREDRSRREEQDERYRRDDSRRSDHARPDDSRRSDYSRSDRGETDRRRDRSRSPSRRGGEDARRPDVDVRRYDGRDRREDRYPVDDRRWRDY